MLKPPEANNKGKILLIPGFKGRNSVSEPQWKLETYRRE